MTLCNDRTSIIDGIMVHSVGDVWFVVVVHSRWIQNYDFALPIVNFPYLSKNSMEFLAYGVFVLWVLYDNLLFIWSIIETPELPVGETPDPRKATSPSRVEVSYDGT